ncbi:MAG: hypothetical protein U0V02_19525 [Anaerolineales bacterium]
MAYSVEYDSVENMIMAKIVRETNRRELQEFGSRIIQMIRRENCFNILTDLREAEMNVSVVEMFNLPFELKEIAAANESPPHARRLQPRNEQATKKTGMKPVFFVFEVLNPQRQTRMNGSALYTGREHKIRHKIAKSIMFVRRDKGYMSFSIWQ